MKNYNVYLWCGCGYVLDLFNTVAECAEDAIERITAQLVNDNKKAFFATQEEVDEWANEECCEDWEAAEKYGYMYVDATMFGAKYPVYLRIENAKIMEA